MNYSSVVYNTKPMFHNLTLYQDNLVVSEIGFMSNLKGINVYPFPVTKESQLYTSIIHPDNLTLAYEKTQKGASKYKVAAVYFERNRFTLLDGLREDLYQCFYSPGEYFTFTVTDPKLRIIHAPQYRDKIVQHALNNILADWFKPHFIHDSYSCITEKGNRRAVIKIQENLRSGLREFGKDCYVVKADIVKFFASIDRTILKRIISKIIKCSLVLNLLFRIIDTAPELNGLPLGNLTSQLLANVYMNILDHFCKRILKCKYYVRYADDFFIVCSSKEKASEILTSIRNFCLTELRLELHDSKSFVQPISKPLSALGFLIHTSYMEIPRTSKSRINRRIRSYCKTTFDGYLRATLENRLNGWLNHANLADLNNYIEHLTDKYPRLECNNGKFNIKKEPITNSI